VSPTLIHFTQTAVNYGEYGLEYSGRVSLIGRIKWVNPREISILPDFYLFCRSHPDVAERHYPQLFRELFPQGIKAGGGSSSGY